MCDSATNNALRDNAIRQGLHPRRRRPRVGCASAAALLDDPADDAIVAPTTGPTSLGLPVTGYTPTRTYATYAPSYAPTPLDGPQSSSSSSSDRPRKCDTCVSKVVATSVIVFVALLAVIGCLLNRTQKPEILPHHHYFSPEKDGFDAKRELCLESPAAEAEVMPGFF